MHEFIGIDFGTIHFRTGIFRSGRYEVIKNYYDDHENHLFLVPGKGGERNNESIPSLCGIKQVFGTDLRNPDIQKDINNKLGTLFEKIYEEVSIDLKSEVINGVITVPCYYHDRERSGLIALAEKSGFNQIRLLDENVALAVGQNLKNESKNILIYSLGAGLFSCTLLLFENGSYRTLNTGCNIDLSGGYMDSVILQIVCGRIGLQFYSLNNEEIKALINVAYMVKKDLSEMQESVLPFDRAVRKGLFLKSQLPSAGTIIITRAEFEEQIKGFIKETIQLCIKTINEAGKQKDNIDLVILAGGATNIPIVQKLVKEEFSTEIIKADKNATVRGASVFASTLPLPQVKAKNPANTNIKKEEAEVRPAMPLKTGDYASQWVKNYATELDAYHQLWQKEAYPESIEMMELVRENVTKFVANLCHIAGKKFIDKGLFQEALDLLKKGYSYDRSDRALAEELHRCYHFLIIETLNKREYAVTKKLLAEGLILNPGNKEWRRLQGSLRNISKNKHNNSKY